jgi:hypothetical protein
LSQITNYKKPETIASSDIIFRGPTTIDVRNERKNELSTHDLFLTIVRVQMHRNSLVGHCGKNPAIYSHLSSYTKAYYLCAVIGLSLIR